MSNNRPVHLEIQTHRKTPVGLIRTTYREDGKNKHETLSRITGVDLDALKLMQAALQGKATYVSDFHVISSKEYGASYACHSVLRDTGLDKAIYSRPNEEWVRNCIAMIVGRIVYQGSKLSLSNCNAYSSLWEICGISDSEIDVNKHCYDAMDKLLERQESIQKSLAKKHFDSGTLVLYDITSSYLEGEYEDSELVNFGYNRDKKRGHEQIVISLLCNREGCPVAVEILKGNTKDETTVTDKINEIKTKYGVSNFIFVGDRGMVTKAQYNKIDHETVKVISALSHGKIKELCNKNLIQMSLFDEENIVEIIDENLRYCLCKNPVMAKKETENRQKLIQKTAEKLDKIIGTTRKCKYSKEVRIGRILNKWKMAKFVILNGSGDDVSWTLNDEKITEEQLLDGCYIVYTDVPSDDMNAVETVKNYKNLIKVEQAFRNLKTVKLEMRPIYHKTDDRIRAHVFLCMLSYYVLWHMKQRLIPLFQTEKTGKNTIINFDYIIELLKSIRLESIDFCGNLSTVFTKPNNLQNDILGLLSVKL